MTTDMSRKFLLLVRCEISEGIQIGSISDSPQDPLDVMNKKDLQNVTLTPMNIGGRVT
jgi:hypothetical protein